MRIISASVRLERNIDHKRSHSSIRCARMPSLTRILFVVQPRQHQRMIAKMQRGHAQQLEKEIVILRVAKIFIEAPKRLEINRGDQEAAAVDQRTQQRIKRHVAFFGRDEFRQIHRKHKIALGVDDLIAAVDDCVFIGSFRNSPI